MKPSVCYGARFRTVKGAWQGNIGLQDMSLNMQELGKPVDLGKPIESLKAKARLASKFEDKHF